MRGDTADPHPGPLHFLQHPAGVSHHEDLSSLPSSPHTEVCTRTSVCGAQLPLGDAEVTPLGTPSWPPGHWAVSPGRCFLPQRFPWVKAGATKASRRPFPPTGIANPGKFGMATGSQGCQGPTPGRWRGGRRRGLALFHEDPGGRTLLRRTMSWALVLLGLLLHRTGEKPRSWRLPCPSRTLLCPGAHTPLCPQDAARSPC